MAGIVKGSTVCPLCFTEVPYETHVESIRPDINFSGRNVLLVEFKAASIRHDCPPED